VSSLTLRALARICTKPDAGADDVVEACAVLRDALGAEDAYVVRAGDPEFIRLGCPCPPSAYEIKQKGYWLIWREGVTHPQYNGGLFDVAHGIVSPGLPLRAGVPTTHAGAILPGDESNSDLLIIRGPWPDGLTEEHAAEIEAARPIIAHLVSVVLDAQRRNRSREQLESLANVSKAFNEASETGDALPALATALAQASGIDWVVIETYDDSGEAVLQRVLNVARYSQTDTAASWRDGRVATPSTGQKQLGAVLAETGEIWLMSDVHDEAAWARRQQINPVDVAPLRKFFERAHILSTSVFPIVFQGQALGSVSFASSTPRRFDRAEVEFLSALVSQAATAIKGLRLYQELQQSRDELREREERFRSLVQHASDLITVLEPDTTVRYQSPSIVRVLGYRPETVLGRKLIDRVHRDDQARFLASLNEMMSKPGAAVTGEGRVRAKGGAWRYLEFIGSDQRENPAIGGIVLNVRDVTERKSLEEQLRDQALHDPLTKLANRTRFTDRLTHALVRRARTGTDVAVLFMDLDNFKGVNDTLGHSAGDRLLTQVAERVESCLRASDTVARLGGDEFALLVEDISDVAEATDVADRVLRALEPPFQLEGKELLVRGSIGLAIAPSGVEDARAEALLRDADTAMYVAKARGKGCYLVFDESMQVSMMERLELLANLQRAVEREEFVLQYQPVMSLSSGRMFGVEALVRWRHPERGIITPLDFIALAEESGAIVSLGRWILREACRQAMQWQREYPDVSDWSLSVNVSAKQLQHASFVEEVAEILADTGVEPRRLILEITESVMMHNAERMQERLRDLKALGLRLAIDDFGTGYSSLSYLKQFPFDLLKIDKSFIDDVREEPQQRELTRAIIELGKTLDLELVAEGIERADQLSRLRELDCELGQGFYFSQPMDPDAIAALLAISTAAPARESDAA
jgi:diguanylate cyclase (GGDEF)-like protein/PAS domain S-box-containing protein